MLNLSGAKEDYTEDSVLEERRKSLLGKAKGKRPSKEKGHDWAAELNWTELKERDECVQSGGGLIVLGSTLSSVWLLLC